jgi:ribosomal protein S20
MMKAKNGIMALFAVLAIAMLLTACATTPAPPPGPAPEAACVPEWEVNPPSAEDGLYGSGIAKMQDAALSKKTADARARDEVTMAIQTKVETMMKDFMQQAGIGDAAQALQLSMSVSKQISSQVLYGCKVVKRQVCPDGTWHSLALWPMDQAGALKKAINDQTKSLVKNEYALYNEFKAKNGFEDLQKELDKLDFTEKEK